MSGCQGAAPRAGGLKGKAGQMKLDDIVDILLFYHLNQEGHIRWNWCATGGGETFVHERRPCSDNRWTQARCREVWNRHSERQCRHVKRWERSMRRTRSWTVSQDHSFAEASHHQSLSCSAECCVAGFDGVSAGWMRLIICIRVNPSSSPLLLRREAYIT